MTELCVLRKLFIERVDGGNTFMVAIIVAMLWVTALAVAVLYVLHKVNDNTLFFVGPAIGFTPFLIGSYLFQRTQIKERI